MACQAFLAEKLLVFVCPAAALVMLSSLNMLGRPNSTERYVTVLHVHLQPHTTGFAQVLCDPQGARGSHKVRCPAGGASNHSMLAQTPDKSPLRHLSHADNLVTRQHTNAFATAARYMPALLPADCFSVIDWLFD